MIVWLLLGLLLISPFFLAVERRSAWLWLLAATLLCLALDGLLLALLPRLGLSFAPGITQPWLLFSIGRVSLLIVALAGIFGFHPGRGLKLWTGAFLAFQGILLALAFYGLYVEPFALTTTTLQVASPAFLPGRPLRLLQISDLHIEHLTRREEAILAQVQALQPDLIVLTGDYLNIDYLQDPQALRETRQFLGQLSAPFGVYAVTGTGGVDLPEIMPKLFAGLPIRLLKNETELLQLPGGTLALLGLDCCQRAEDAAQLTRLAQALPPETFSLLLYHTPDLAEAAQAAQIDVYLAGHTHGGQVRLPFYGALVTSSVYGKRFEMGKYQLGETTLYVSRGLGLEGLNLPRLRFLAPPELVWIELTP